MQTLLQPEPAVFPIPESWDKPLTVYIFITNFNNKQKRKGGGSAESQEYFNQLMSAIQSNWYMLFYNWMFLL